MINFSIDDVFGCFRWLTQNNSETIYDSFVFNNLKKIHDKYDFDFTLFCMYTDGVNTLENISDKWKDEFIEAKDWLHFGFHCWGPNSNYSKTDSETFILQYRKMKEELNRITGISDFSQSCRLHYFSGNPQLVRAMSDEGIKALLCADDERISYGLSSDINSLIREKGFYLDDDAGINYIRTDLRVEKWEYDYRKIKELTGNKYKVIFTHEPLLGDKVIIDKIEKIVETLLYNQNVEGTK